MEQRAEIHGGWLKNVRGRHFSVFLRAAVTARREISARINNRVGRGLGGP